MKRRTLLKGVLVASAGGAIAGCLDDGGRPAGGGETDDDVDDGFDDDTDDPADEDRDDDEDAAEERVQAIDDDALPEGVIDQHVTTEDASCGSGGEASVTAGDETVEIAGTVTAPNPCHTAVIASMDLDDDRLSVHVDITADDVDACVECVGGIEYVATIQFDGRPPAETVVTHGGHDDGEVERTSS